MTQTSQRDRARRAASRPASNLHPPMGSLRSRATDSGAGQSSRCWICLDDEDSLEGMISPCSCTGSTKWVHKSCLKTYCLQHLASHPSATLSVSCPICRSPYSIVPRQVGFNAPWRELLRCTSTDQQLLLRHCRFALLVLPLITTTTLAWCWLFPYWEDVVTNGHGPDLYTELQPLELKLADRPPVLRGALTWLPAYLSELLALHLFAVESAQPQPHDGPSSMPLPVESVRTGTPHPAGISQKWSLLYVWLQYVQWYKILSWLLIMVLGGAEGLLPQNTREVFKIEELLFASETRAQLFFIGQFCPFVLSKLRHFLVVRPNPLPPTTTTTLHLTGSPIGPTVATRRFCCTILTSVAPEPTHLIPPHRPAPHRTTPARPVPADVAFFFVLHYPLHLLPRFYFSRGDWACDDLRHRREHGCHRRCSSRPSAALPVSAPPCRLPAHIL